MGVSIRPADHALRSLSSGRQGCRVSHRDPLLLDGVERLRCLVRQVEAPAIRWTVALISAPSVYSVDTLTPGEAQMTDITLPADLERSLRKQARRLGTTPELLAVESLRRLFHSKAEAARPAPGETLFDFLSGHIGTVEGTAEALSENGGGRFADDLMQRHQQGRL